MSHDGDPPGSHAMERLRALDARLHDERGMRAASDLCLRCGRAGHTAASCPRPFPGQGALLAAVMALCGACTLAGWYGLGGGLMAAFAGLAIGALASVAIVQLLGGQEGAP